MYIQDTATDQAARTGAWRTLLRIQKRKLITCTGAGAEITVTLLRKDGSGKAYDRPRGESEEERFLQIFSTPKLPVDRRPSVSACRRSDRSPPPLKSRPRALTQKADLRL
ncbi:hypothetical protein [Streptomyces yanii]|uniref:hypothetical protein n=1 Tax=Streptomyces yanii TaxID=78510 RepID=UPI0031E780AE